MLVAKLDEQEALLLKNILFIALFIIAIVHL